MKQCEDSPLAKLDGLKDPAPSKPGKHLFAPGHPKYGGRKKGSKNKRTKLAEAIFDKLEKEIGPVDPIEGLLRIGSNKKLPVATRIEALKAVLPFLYPRLQAMALTSNSETPTEVKIDVAGIIASPELATAAQKLGLALAAAPKRALPPAVVVDQDEDDGD